jgi:hypothetical protein
VGDIRSGALYNPNQSNLSKGGAVNAYLNQIGHLIIGALAIGGITTLAVLHDITGSSAVIDILATMGVSLGIGAATNSIPVTASKVGP